jgi:hypothetical protein
MSARVEGQFVIAHVGGHRLAVDVRGVVEIIAEAPRGSEAIEALLGGDRPPGPRVCLRLRRGVELVELDVPTAGLAVGESLRGECHTPALVAAAFDRCCLRGVVRRGDELIFVIDLDRLWSRIATAMEESP